MSDWNTYIEDLSPCTYFGFYFRNGVEKVKAVGWLAWGHAYTERESELSETYFCQLLRLLQHPWEPGHFMGAHECVFCFGTEEYTKRYRLERYGLVVHFGASNLFVPGEGCIYVAPSMIAHYVDAHGYEPPTEFWEAVMSCPEMGSDNYKQALLINGPKNKRWTRDVLLE